ncbi:MAG: hypothetical protein QOE76_2899 [Frankiales bacterium]|jgi:hypothetical protein|nr:hypothetical protein [Frankiales bacterium]
MTTTAQVPVSPTPTLAQEMRDTMLLFGMFGLAFALLAGLLGAAALLQALAS